MTKSIGTIVLENTFTPFNTVNAIIIGLLTAAYVSTDDQRLVWDSLGVITVVIANTTLAIIQEVRAHRSLERASALRPPQVTVRRNEHDVTLGIDEVIVGDIVTIHRGDIVPADGMVISSQGAELDVSLLTGESDPVHVTANTPVHTGTWCVAGSMTLRVTAIGGDTEAAQIELLSRRVDLRPSPLQRRVNALFTGSFVIAILLAGTDLLREGASALSNVDSIRRVATLVLGMIPEGLVFFSTITLIAGIVRIARRGVVVQKVAAMEGLASASVVCFDKTGTLTTNQLEVTNILPLDGSTEDEARRMLSSIAHAIGDQGRMPDAFRSSGMTDTKMKPIEVIPFSSSRKYSACRTQPGGWWTIGAIDIVMTPQHPQWEPAQGVIRNAGLSSYRIVAVCSTDEPYPVGTHVVPRFVVVLADSVREDASATMNMFADIDMRRVILSGDAEPPVRQALSQLNLQNQDDIDVRARCSPLDKREIIRGLAATSTVVMIGDGINDLPAIKEADVGIAMPESSPATKLAADIVLENASFADFPAMIAEGRRSVRTVMAVAVLFMSKNVVLIVLSALTALAAAPYHLSPRRGALLSLVGVAIPSIVLATRSSMTSATRNFFAELIGKFLLTAAEMIVAYVLVQSLFAGHPHIASLLMMTLVASLLGRFVVIDHMAQQERSRLAVISATALVIVALLIILPTTIPVVNIVQIYYEIGGAGWELLPALSSSAAIGLLSAAPWVFLPREQARHRA
jgi:cation-transporting ATPase E